MQSLEKRLASIICLIAPFALYAVILTLPLPPQIGLTVRYKPLVAILLIFLGLYPTYRYAGRAAASASLTLTLVLFALPLTGLWNSGMSEFPAVVSGLFPSIDALYYYEDARRLLEGESFGMISSGRPLFAGLLAVILGLTGQNLQWAIAILVALVAIAVFLLAREVQRTHGLLAALMVVSVLFLFYRRFNGTAFTENLGLLLGTVGFALLWRSVYPKKVSLFLLGLLLLTLALNARAGVFLVLPILALWGGWCFRQTSRFSLRIVGYGFGVICLGFALNHLLLIAVGDPTLSFSNFSYVLYASVVGSKLWWQVRLDHPAVEGLPLAEVTSAIYGLAYAAFRENPLIFARTCLEAWAKYLSPTIEGALQFIQVYERSRLDKLLTYVIYIFSLLGLFQCYRQRQNPAYSLLLAISLGVMLSLPFVPPWIGGTGTTRTYAATLPISALLPAIGLSFVVTSSKLNPLLPALKSGLSIKALPSFSLLLALFCVLGPISIKTFSQTSQFEPVQCPASTDRAYIRVASGSLLHIVPRASRPTHLPYIQVTDLRQGVKRVKQILQRRPPTYLDHEVETLAALKPGKTVIDALNLGTQHRLLVVVDTLQIPEHSNIVQVCGKLQENLLLADSIQAIPSSGKR
jgi:hypothetical protein